MFGASAQRLRSLAEDWARRRQGEDSHNITLKRRRIYILPTRPGIVFGALVFAMLLASLNYGASLGFALTFLLAGLGLLIMQHCHNNLLGIRVHFAGAEPVFAGTEAAFRIRLENATRGPRFDILAAAEGTSDGPVDLEPGSGTPLELRFATAARGWRKLPRFSVSTQHPGNLFRAWTWVHMDARCLVYPAPAAPGRPFPLGVDALGSRTSSNRAEDDFAGLRDTTPGDPPKRIAWKAYARNGQLLTKDFAGGAERPCLFDWDDLDGLGTEARLEQLTRWCLDAAEQRLSFGLVLPDRRIPLGTGDRHLHRCLEALALHGLVA